MIWWITGRSDSGKTTFSLAMAQALKEDGLGYVRLDGNMLRDGLCRDLGFTDAHRSENLRRAASIAGLLSRQGLHVICSFISPSEEGRARAFKNFQGEPYRLIHVATPLEVCEKRDSKGLYKKMRNGEIDSLTGSTDYEVPMWPDFTITGRESKEARLTKAKDIIRL